MFPIPTAEPMQASLNPQRDRKLSRLVCSMIFPLFSQNCGGRRGARQPAPRFCAPHQQAHCLVQIELERLGFPHGQPDLCIAERAAESSPPQLPPMASAIRERPPQQAVGRQHTDGPQQDIRPPGVERHGVLAGGAVVRPRPRHSGGGQKLVPSARTWRLGHFFFTASTRPRPMPPPWPSTTATSSSPRIILSIPPFSDLPFQHTHSAPACQLLPRRPSRLAERLRPPLYFSAWRLQWEAHHRVKKFLEILKKSGPQSRMIDVGRQKEVAARREQTDKRVLFPAGSPV